MQEAMTILFKTMFPECKNDNVRFIGSRDIKGNPFFYAMHEGKKVKCFQDRLQVIEQSGKGEKVVIELTIEMIFAMANIYHDGTNFM